jgi:hypothetical protein
MNKCFVNIGFLLLLLSSSLAFDDEAVTWSRQADEEEATTSFPDGLDRQAEQSLLMWALSHSDPELLTQAAAASEIPGNQSLEAKRARVKLLREIMDRQGQVSETQIMKDIIKRLALPEAEGLEQDLRSLLALVESIDNANDLKPLGSLPLLIDCLDSKHSTQVRALSASIIGKAAGNNVKFQNDLMEFDPKFINRLVKMTREALDQNNDDLGLQALYALSSTVVNSPEHRKQFIDLQGNDLLLNCLRREMKMQKKALTFLADLNEYGVEIGGTEGEELARLMSRGIVERGEDDDLVEKALSLVLLLVQRDRPWATLFASHRLAEALGQIERRLQSEEEPNEELIKLTRDAISALIDASNKEEL